MEQLEKLFEFENKYKRLYDITLSGFPVYTVLRGNLQMILRGERLVQSDAYPIKKDRISIKRIVDSFLKFRKFKDSMTLIFTSSVYRRDYGRNLAVEYLIERYPKACVFEWPTREKLYDDAYVNDALIEKYCPMEYYLLVYKVYKMFHKREYDRYRNQCVLQIKGIFNTLDERCENDFKNAIEYIQEAMPQSYASIAMSQKIFQKLFQKYRHVKYAIDFWGSARENIIPVLQGNPESIELQHGVITSSHPGYVYPEFVKGKQPFFQRRVLVYGRSTKDILCNNSIFEERKVDIIGNPRIKKYLEEHRRETQERKYLLFTSQPYEQDFGFSGYYDTVFEFLRELKECIHSNVDYSDYKIAIKLHPRENENIKKRYAEVLGDDVEYFGSDKDLYGLLSQTFIHFTVNSTVLYEAAEFGCPTIIFPYGKFDMKQMFGEHTRIVSTKQGMVQCLEELSDVQEYDKYLKYLVQITKEFM